MAQNSGSGLQIHSLVTRDLILPSWETLCGHAVTWEGRGGFKLLGNPGRLCRNRPGMWSASWWAPRGLGDIREGKAQRLSSSRELPPLFVEHSPDHDPSPARTQLPLRGGGGGAAVGWESGVGIGDDDGQEVASDPHFREVILPGACSPAGQWARMAVFAPCLVNKSPLLVCHLLGRPGQVCSGAFPRDPGVLGRLVRKKAGSCSQHYCACRLMGAWGAGRTQSLMPCPDCCSFNMGPDGCGIILKKK